MNRFHIGSSYWRMALLIFALLMPAIVNGSALPFPDSVSYIKGGPLALEKLGELIDKLIPHSSSQLDSTVTTGDVNSEKAPSGDAIAGMRSATYSVYAYLMGALANNGFFIVAGQAAMTAFTVMLFFRSFVPTLSARDFMFTVAAITFLTSAPWYSSFAMPDILGAAAVLTMVMFFFHSEKLNRLEKAALSVITAFAITAHPGNLLLVAALTGFGVVERITRDIRAKRSFAFTVYGWAIAPLALGVGAILAISVLGFGEASVAPKRYPFALARSVTDGPAFWHLEKHCDTYQYAVCEVFDEIPRGVGEFLWEETGLRYRATPEQLDRIRAEEMVIVTRAAREYPMAQFRTALKNTYDQIKRIGIPSVGLGHKLMKDDGGEWKIVEAEGEYSRFVQPIETVQIIIVYLSLGMLAYLILRRKSVGTNELRVIAFIAAALFVNAVICGVLSGPADRYQGRLIWIAPMVAILLVATDKPWKNRRTPNAKIPAT